jgi:GH15 family glucan-1,4-alpha-glucosidase
MYAAHRAGIETSDTEWHLQVELMKYLETKWSEPDEGIWEVRGGRQQFTHSKMMAWVAFDRAVKMSEDCDCPAAEHVERWRGIRDEIHRQVCERGYNAKKKAFTQVYGAEELDGSLLMMPLIGFLPIDDERAVNTIKAIERELMWDGFVLRYRAEVSEVDGLPGGEGVFLPCSFWYAACLHLMGRTDEARALFERLLKLRNDLGLYSEEYDPVSKRQLGNFPQAFTHVAMINTAQLLSGRRQVPAAKHT